MKKCIVLVFVIIVLICGCTNKSNYIINYKEFVNDSVNTPENITYKFIGKSKKFAFETGQVSYGENGKRYILIGNFKIIDKIKNQNDIKNYSIDLRFNNISLTSNDIRQLSSNNIETDIKNFFIEEDGIYSSDGIGEMDAFIKTTKDDFKSSIELKIKYCYSNNKCQTEKFDLYYVK